jgi:hypothetical protein
MTSSNGVQDIILKGTDVTDYCYRIRYHSTASYPSTGTGFATSISTADIGAYILPSPPLNQWVHFVGTYDGTVFKSYQDGVFKATSSTIPSSAFNNTANLIIGAGQYHFGSGKIDDIRIYNRALSGSEVSQLYGEPDPLPVELTSFNSTLHENKVLLNWNTATELNNFGFEIEKSEYNSQWIKVGFVEGNGTSNSPHSYSFNDIKSKEKSFYRLKQIDRDGKFEYSQQIEVAASDPQSFELKQNHPNPFNPSTTISFSLPTKSFVSLKIFDAIGKEVADVVSEELPTGNYSRQWNASHIPSGIYFYRLVAGSYSETKKLLLLK